MSFRLGRFLFIAVAALRWVASLFCIHSLYGPLSAITFPKKEMTNGLGTPFPLFTKVRVFFHESLLSRLIY